MHTDHTSITAGAGELESQTSLDKPRNLPVQRAEASSPKEQAFLRTAGWAGQSFTPGRQPIQRQTRASFVSFDVLPLRAENHEDYQPSEGV